MTWRGFMEYVVMLELGQSDAVHRNYDLQHLNGAKPGQVLDRAYARMGFDQKNTLRAHILPSVRAHMRNMGYAAPGDDALAALIREWYIWDRIRAGDLTRQPLKPVDNPLF